METILLGIFILGYLAITLEHSLKIDKLIPALGMMALLWALISVFNIPVFEVDTEIRELIPTKIKKIMAYHLSHTSEILIFLLGAMTIVEIIDYYNGFEKIKLSLKKIFQSSDFLMHRLLKSNNYQYSDTSKLQEMQKLKLL